VLYAWKAELEANKTDSKSIPLQEAIPRPAAVDLFFGVVIVSTVGLRERGLISCPPTPGATDGYLVPAHTFAR